jgi:hypothetical protein
MAMKNSKGETVSLSEEGRALARERLFELSKIIQKAVRAKDAYRVLLGELANDENRAMFSPEHLAALKDAAKRELMDKNAALHDELTGRIDELRSALDQAHASLELDNPALTNALKMIELAGAELGYENIQRINAQFAHDQAALRLLQSVYKARGIVADGGLDKQIYNLNDAIASISHFSEYALKGAGSLNQLAGAIGKVAQLEGFEFETLPDPVGFEETTRRAAGLP